MKFNEQGIPFSLDYQDTYYSVSGPVEESKYVFIQANQLEHRWQDKNFTIAEIGFGFGLNFLTSCHAWLTNRRNRHQLHYISFEKHPVSKDDMLQCHKNLGIESDLSSMLCENYPLPVRGFHRIHLNQQNIYLTLIHGDALEYLPEASFEADCWYLDGFSPSKNQELWSQDIAHEVYRLTRPGGTFSTYSAASQVKNNFRKAGFSINKHPGFHNKREMLTGICDKKQQKPDFHHREKSWFNIPSVPVKEKQITIIGAGLAGICIAAAMARRNWHVTVIDKHPHPAREGSGNKNAILMPRLSIDHDTQSQITLSGYLYSLGYFQTIKKLIPDFHWQQCGAIQIPRDQKQQQRMRQLIEQENIPDDLLRPVDKEQIKILCGCDCADDGWYIPLAGWTAPEEICHNLLDIYKDNIEFIGNREVSSIDDHNNGWSVLDKQNHEISMSRYLVIANASNATEFRQTRWCRIFPKRGQVTYLSKTSSNIHPLKIICSDAYITPEIEDQYVLGASFVTADRSLEVRESEHRDNIARVKKMIPSFEPDNSETIDGRAAIRAVSQDRLPIVGPVAKADEFYQQFAEAAQGATHMRYGSPVYYRGLYVATAFGSRGLAWIPLCAEIMAGMINDEPLPVGKSLINSIHPNRYLMKNLISQKS